MGSAFNAVNAILPLLAPTAKVFNISSAIAHTDFIPDVWLYSATKAANIKMFDYLQVENPDLHVVNIQPGVVATGINPDFEGQDEGKQRMSCFLRHNDSVFLLRELAD
jgi:NAD(P)-dependent dehydrogenase (short-subunit alcohol dehydrogenase family)